MSRKDHPLANKLWIELRELISPIPENNFEELLAVLKTWISSHPILLQNLNSECVTLSSLLDDKASQFNFVISTAGANLKRIINSELYPYKNITSIVERLEVIVREFAIFTSWETCPICDEGYLNYWKDVNINEIVLWCPECGWQQYLNKEQIDDDNLKLSFLLPAYKEDIKMLNCDKIDKMN